MSSVIYFLIGLLLLLIGIVFTVGALLPRAHVASRSIEVNASPENVWGLIANPAGYPSWRTGLKSVEMLDNSGGLAKWVEVSGRQLLAMAMVESTPVETIVTKIDDESLPFGGTWTINLSSLSDEGTRIEITERGFVNPPPFRFISRFVIGQTATMTRYLADLQKQFEAKV